MSDQPAFALRWLILTAVIFLIGMFLFLLMLPEHTFANDTGVGFTIFGGACLAAYMIDKLFQVSRR
jgi:lipoprotein signal peptidase